MTGSSFEEEGKAEPGLERLVQDKIRRVTADIERLHYNTAIAACMELLAALVRQPRHLRRHAGTLLRLLEPFAPFVTHELWERLGFPGMLCEQPWPSVREERWAEDDGEVEVAIQVDGRLRDTMRLRRGATPEEAVASALDRERVRRHLEGRSVERSVLVPDRLLNIVTASTEGP